MNTRARKRDNQNSVQEIAPRRKSVVGPKVFREFVFQKGPDALMNTYYALEEEDVYYHLMWDGQLHAMFERCKLGSKEIEKDWNYSVSFDSLFSPQQRKMMDDGDVDSLKDSVTGVQIKALLIQYDQNRVVKDTTDKRVTLVSPRPQGK